MNKVVAIKPTELLTESDIRLAENAAVIRALGKRVVGDIIEIGRRLIDSKKECAHGAWLPWLKREFDWDQKTADRFMDVAESKLGKLPNLNIPVSGLYLLAAPSTPATVIDAVAKRSAEGDKVSLAEVKRMIAEAQEEAGGAERVRAEAKIAKLEAQFAEREKAVREEFAKAKLSEKDVLALVKQATEPLKKRIKAYKEQLAKKPPIKTPPLSYETTSVSYDLARLAKSVSAIKPERMLEVYRERVAMTNELAAKPLEQDLENGVLVLSWLTAFQTLAKESSK